MTLEGLWDEEEVVGREEAPGTPSLDDGGGPMNCNFLNPNHMGWGKLSKVMQNFVNSARILNIITLYY